MRIHFKLILHIRITTDITNMKRIYFILRPKFGYTVIHSKRYSVGIMRSYSNRQLGTNMIVTAFTHTIKIIASRKGILLFLIHIRSRLTTDINNQINVGNLTCFYQQSHAITNPLTSWTGHRHNMYVFTHSVWATIYRS